MWRLGICIYWVRIKGGNCEGGNWDLVDLVDLVNLFNSAEIYKNTRRNKETIGAAFGCAPQGRRAPLWLVSLILLVFLYISAELNKLTKSTKSQLPPLQLPPFTPPQFCWITPHARYAPILQ